MFRNHATLILEGTLPDFLHVVIDGSVEVFCTHDGHETTIDIMQPPAAFILASAIRNDIYLSSARTLAPSQILLMPAKQIRDVFDRDPAFARAIALELTEHHRNAVRALMDKKLRTGTKRLANWILRTDAMQGNQRTIELTSRETYARVKPRNDAGKSVTKPRAAVQVRSREALDAKSLLKIHSRWSALQSLIPLSTGSYLIPRGSI